MSNCQNKLRVCQPQIQRMSDKLGSTIKAKDQLDPNPLLPTLILDGIKYPLTVLW